MLFDLSHRTLRLGMAPMLVFVAALVTTLCDLEVWAAKWPVGSAGGGMTSIPDEEELVSSLLMKPRPQAGSRLAGALQAVDAGELSKQAQVPLTVMRQMSGGVHVIKLHKAYKLSEARVIAARLMQNDPSLEYVEPDRVLHNLTTPTDPGYGNQWHYGTPAGSNKGGVNLPIAWDITKGNPSVVVAVIDSGYRPHVEFGTAIVPGYDFITDPVRANDGDGRDANAQDPGNWQVAGECGGGTPAKDSVWHGTHVTGTIIAAMNNGQGGTGVAPNVKVVPVRVTGKCGGVLSDIIDGMRWAAGFAVAGAPVNANPAMILNLSIGDHTSCSATLQAAVTEIVNAGKVIVAATDNNSDTSIDEPANCNGVIAVTAHAIDGDLAYYSNVSSQVAISAPGGDCGKLTFLSGTCTPGSGLGTYAGLGAGIYTTYNSGTTTPVADSYFPASGTSSAAPHVSGVAALLLSVKPLLTPPQVRAVVQGAARPFPLGSSCASGGSVAGLCGAGLLDALAAINGSAVPPAVTIPNASQVVAPNLTVALSGAATADVGRSISSYQWTQLTGASVGTIANSNQATASFTAPATGLYSFQLTATDTGGLVGTATATVRVNSPPVLTPVGPQAVLDGKDLTFTVGATDVDGDTPIFVSVAVPPGASLSAAGVFSWPAATPVGSYPLTYFARDNDANSPQQTVTISVTLTADTHPPTMPSSLSGSVLSGTQISLSWPASTDDIGVTGYEVERCQGAGCTTFVLIASPTTTSYVDTGLTPGVSYSYRVRARDTTGNFSAYSPITSFALPPGRTSLFTDIFNRADNADLGVAYTDSYTGSTTGRILSQRLVPSVVEGRAVEQYTGVSTPSDQWSEVTIGALTGGVVAQVGAHVRLTNPTIYSGYRCFASINQTNKAGIRRFDAGNSTPIGANDTTTVWGVGDTLRCEIKGTTIKLYRVVGTVETLLISATDATYASGTTGIYAYVATGGAVTNAQISRFAMGGYSVTADTTSPTAPGSLAAITSSGTQISLSWPAATDNIGVTGYEVERCQGAGCSTFALIATTTAVSYVDSGLISGLTYSYRIRARDAAGNVSAYSPVATSTTVSSTTVLTTLAIDAFDRPDNLDLGSVWDVGYLNIDKTNARIVSNAVRATMTNTSDPKSAETYNGVVFPNDQWCQFTLGTWQGTEDREVGCTLRAAAPPTTNWYWCYARANGARNAAIVSHHVGGIGDTNLASNFSVVWAPGDKLRCEAQGATLRLYRIPFGTTNETLLLSATDSEWTSGRTGILMWMQTGGTLANATIADWAAGGFTGSVQSPIAFDAVSSSASGNTTNMISWSHTVGNGTNRFLAVCTQARDTVASDVAVVTVTANGFPLTKVRADLRTDAGSSFGTELWYLPNPGIGVYSITVTWAGALSSYGVGASTSYFGVDQVAPIDAHAGSGGIGATLSKAITTVANHAVIVDCALAQSDPLTIGVGQTSRVNRRTTGTVDAVGVSTVNDKTPAGTETMDWTQSAAQNWVISAVSLRPAP